MKEGSPRHVLLLTGGLGHPAEVSAAPLEEFFGGHGLAVDSFEDVDTGLAALDRERHALLVVNALRCTMTDARFDQVRSTEGYVLSAAGRAALGAWLVDGAPVLALHTGVLCFDDFTPWAEALGGRWDWTRSFHPPIGRMSVCTGAERFDVFDEHYQDLDLTPHMDVVATGAGGPLAWTHDHGPGSAAVDLLGHDARSLDHPEHRRLLSSLVHHLLEHR